MSTVYLRFCRLKILSTSTCSTIYSILPAGKQHSSDFSCLIAQVRGRLETNRQTRIKQEVIVVGEDEPSTLSAGTATLNTFLRLKYCFATT